MKPKKNRPGIGDLIALIMLKFLLKTMKKGGGANMKMPPPSLIIFPKKPQPKSDLLLENKRIIYKCGLCGQRFILKSDIKLEQKTVMEWMTEVRSHGCHAN